VVFTFPIGLLGRPADAQVFLAHDNVQLLRAGTFFQQNLSQMSAKNWKIIKKELLYITSRVMGKGKAKARKTHENKENRTEHSPAQLKHLKTFSGPHRTFSCTDHAPENILRTAQHILLHGPST
jgi:predicted alpha/beta-hydrolase family hydrolase